MTTEQYNDVTASLDTKITQQKRISNKRRSILHLQIQALVVAGYTERQIALITKHYSIKNKIHKLQTRPTNYKYQQKALAKLRKQIEELEPLLP